MKVVAIWPFDVLDEAEQAMVTDAFDFAGALSNLRVYEIRPHTGRRYRLVAPVDDAIKVGSQVAAAEEFGGVFGVNTEARHVHLRGTSRLVLA
jgi:hypothetical protein